MTEQEQQLISGLAERIRNTPAQQVDRDAYDLILHTIGTRPDALYLLTQIVIMQQMALNHAQSQGSFLPGQQQPAPPAYQEQRYQDSSYAAPPPPPPQGGGFSGFLHNAAQTAAGVIAGEIAFDSLASIFGHRGGGGFFGGGGGFFGGGGGYPSETIINNNYGDDRGGNGGDDTRFADAANQNQDVSSDIDDERDNSGDSFSDDGSSSGDDGS
jgi:uncharacterized protein